MLRRLFLLLLLVAFATPAAAMPACHEPAPAATARHAHGADRHPSPEKATPAHVCIGCVPIADWLSARIAAPILPGARISVPLIVRLDLGRGIAPALPPPRQA